MTDYEMLQIIIDRFDESVKHLATKADIIGLGQRLEAHLKKHEEDDKNQIKLRLAVFSALLTGSASLFAAFFY